MEERCRTLLLVEDEPIVALDEKRQLEEYGYSVHSAHTGEEAVDIIHRSTVAVELVLMDIDLGTGIDGTQAAQQILRIQSLPIVFLSSYTERNIVEKTEKITSYGYVVKNSGIVVLDASIQMAFRLFDTTTQLVQANEELRSARAALAEQKKQAEITLQSIGDGVISTDIHGRIVQMNPVAEELCGWRLQEAAGRPLAEVFQIKNSYTGEAVANPVAAVLQSGTITGLANHTVLTSRDGSQYQISDSAAPIKSSDGTLYGVIMVFSDVTDAYAQEEALRTSEDRFQKTMQIIPDLISLHDTNMNIVYSNWNGFGAVPPEKRVVPSKCYTVYRGRDDICPDCRAVEVLQTGNTLQDEISLPDGRWYDLRMIPIISDNGDVDLFVEWVRDITEEKRSEQELKNTIHRMQRLHEACDRVNTCVYMKDTALRYIFANRATMEYFGCTEEELLQSTDAAFFSPETVSRILEIDRRVLQGESTEEIVDTRDADNNGQVFLEIKSPLYSLEDHETITGIMGISTNITGRVQAEELMQESEKKYRLLFDTMQEGFALHEIICDAENTPVDYRFLDINPAFEQLTGLKKADVVGKTLFTVLPESEKEWVEMYGTVALSGTPISFENYSQVLDRYYHVVAFSPQKNRFATLFTDVTQQKDAREKIQKQLAEKETLLQEVHHRVKNNIAGIEGLLSLQADSAYSSEVASALHEALSRVQSMRVLYDKLLIGTDYRDVSARSYIESLVESLTRIFSDNREIVIETDIEEIIVHSRRLLPVGIIINELVTNAFKYAFVEREAGRIMLVLCKQENSIHLTITDDGTGFSPDERGQGDYGFGFTIVTMLTEQLNGTFTVEGGDGTKCRLTFPMS